MGLGKTVMVLALVLKSLEEGVPTFEHKKDDQWLSNEKSKICFISYHFMSCHCVMLISELIPSKCSLIIVPPGVIGQWENEVKAKTRNVKYCLFHGPKRTTSAAE
jgi:SNF2 family DNA or RNA helicase